MHPSPSVKHFHCLCLSYSYPHLCSHCLSTSWLLLFVITFLYLYSLSVWIYPPVTPDFMFGNLFTVRWKWAVEVGNPCRSASVFKHHLRLSYCPEANRKEPFSPGTFTLALDLDVKWLNWSPCSVSYSNDSNALFDRLEACMELTDDENEIGSQQRAFKK